MATEKGGNHSQLSGKRPETNGFDEWWFPSWNLHMSSPDCYPQFRWLEGMYEYLFWKRNSACIHPSALSIYVSSKINNPVELMIAAAAFHKDSLTKELAAHSLVAIHISTCQKRECSFNLFCLCPKLERLYSALYSWRIKFGKKYLFSDRSDDTSKILRCGFFSNIFLHVYEASGRSTFPIHCWYL